MISEHFADDVVRRLKAHADATPYDDTRELMREAADEVERLRAVLAELGEGDPAAFVREIATDLEGNASPHPDYVAAIRRLADSIDQAVAAIDPR